jgi:hypothetical protein
MSSELTQWQKYCNLCEDKGIYNPYKTEADYNRAYGILEDAEVPLVIKPKHVKPFVEPTLEANIKGKRPSKPKIVRTAAKPKTPKLSDEQLKINRLINNRKYQEKKRRERGVVPRVFLTPEEEKQKKKEYMKKWQENNRAKVNEAARAWKKKNRDKVMESNKTWIKNNPDKQKEIQRRSNAKRKKVAL